ncbi:hypothetical protein [Actinomadura sp. 6N118]|uniref:hypothetical protein n=1 Tax=Actinomadura sp. 6N118 TaxID=3375151 RepID=UPI0037976A9A
MTTRTAVTTEVITTTTSGNGIHGVAGWIQVTCVAGAWLMLAAALALTLAAAAGYVLAVFDAPAAWRQSLWSGARTRRRWARELFGAAALLSLLALVAGVFA